MKYGLILFMLLGCASFEPIKNEHGTVISLESPEEVLKAVAGTEQNVVVLHEDDRYLLFITPKPIMKEKPLVINSDDLSELLILIEQYVNKGWQLSGSISTSSTFGKMSYHATLVK